ncbi:MAG: hypothetical protein BWY78_00574 [Alphaproteobacteria bacterium ADurb.Bin438]|nr:MAG: hypothetical protein BWY78_00574 [Alphaproteobacteria bacterium ADurb.Bin438]
MIPRGIRNNNPGNIRHGEKWQGLAKDQKDESFCTFETPEYGIRALCKIIKTYRNKYGLKTVKEIIDRFAPPVENDTKAYINHVANALDIEPTTEFDLNQDNLLILIKSIIKHENGIQPYSNETIIKGINMS